MDRSRISAEFATREAAESVIRKLAFLRGDSFEVTEAAGGALRNGTAGMADLEAAGTLGDLPEASGTVFIVTANVPTAAAERSLTVVAQAGGLHTALAGLSGRAGFEP